MSENTSTPAGLKHINQIRAFIRDTEQYAGRDTGSLRIDVREITAIHELYASHQALQSAADANYAELVQILETHGITERDKLTDIIGRLVNECAGLGGALAETTIERDQAQQALAARLPKPGESAVVNYAGVIWNDLSKIEAEGHDVLKLCAVLMLATAEIIEEPPKVVARFCLNIMERLQTDGFKLKFPSLPPSADTRTEKGAASE